MSDDEGATIDRVGGYTSAPTGHIEVDTESGTPKLTQVSVEINVGDTTEHDWDKAEHIVTTALTNGDEVVPLDDLLPHIPGRRVKGFVTATTDDGQPAIPTEDAAAIVEHGQRYDAT